MIQNKVNAGWIILNNMIDSVKPSKALWFPAIIKQLYINVRVEVGKGKERIKVELAISARAFDEAPQIGGEWIAVEILEEVKRIKEMQEKMLTFMIYQHKWNIFMQNKCDKNEVDTIGVLIPNKCDKNEVHTIGVPVLNIIVAAGASNEATVDKEKDEKKRKPIHRKECKREKPRKMLSLQLLANHHRSLRRRKKKKKTLKKSMRKKKLPVG